MKNYICKGQTLKVVMFFSSRQFFQITSERIRGFLPNSTTLIVTFVFWRNLRIAKSPFEINWPLSVSILFWILYSWFLFHYCCEKAVTHKKTHILGIRYTCSVENLPFEAQTKNVQDMLCFQIEIQIKVSWIWKEYLFNVETIPLAWPPLISTLPASSTSIVNSIWFIRIPTYSL